MHCKYLAFAFLVGLLCTTACKKPNDNPATTKKLFQDSIDISGVYGGDFYRNEVISLAVPRVDRWDTISGLHVDLRHLDSNRLQVHVPMTTLNNEFTATIERVLGSNDLGADLYFFENSTKQWKVYYFRMQDSIYMKYNSVMSGGHLIQHHYYGKK